MRDTLTVQTWDLKFPWLIRVLVTDPGRRLPCHLSKAVLRTPGLGRTAFLFYRAEQFILFPLFEHDWHVHQREHRQEQHGEADPVVADMVAEPRERIAVRRIHQKLEIRIEQQVDAINRHRHRQQQQEALAHVPDARSDITARKQHDGIGRKQNVHARRMPEHEVRRRKRRPRREQQCRRRCGDTDKIEEIVEQPARLPCVQRDKENVDRAQVQRQIVPVEIPADLQTDLFKRLVREQENGKEPPQLRPFLLVRRLVELAAQRGKADIQRKRHQMPR